MNRFSILFLFLIASPLLYAQEGEQSYNLPRQFSSTQGENNWFYYAGVPNSHTVLTWTNEVSPWGTRPYYCWAGGARYLQVVGRSGDNWMEVGPADQSGWLIPGENQNITIGWQAPQSGTIRLSAMLNTCYPTVGNIGTDDGVYLSVYKETTEVIAPVRIFHGLTEEDRIADAYVQTSLSVLEGEFVYFYIHRGVWQDADQMYYSFSITYDSDGDIQPPQSSHRVIGNQLFLSAVDSGSGVAVLEYRQYFPSDGGWQVYDGPITIDNELATGYMYRAIDSAGNVEAYHRVTVSRRIGIAGTVSSAETEMPLEGVLVNAEDFYGNCYTATTDSSGRYEIVVPSEGSYRVSFSKNGYCTMWWNGDGGTLFRNMGGYVTLNTENNYFPTNVNGVLELGGTISGLTTAYGKPVKTDVYIYYLDLEQTEYIGRTMEDGTYSVTVPVGHYGVYFEFADDTYPPIPHRGSIYFNQKKESYDTVVVQSVNDVIPGINAEFGLPEEEQPLRILRVFDVPNDEGKQVFVQWKFTLPEEEIGYKIQNTLSDKKNLFPQMSVENGIDVIKFSVWRLDETVWTQVGEVTFRQDSIFSAVVPTIFDSTKNKGMYYSTFQISAHNYYGEEVLRTLPDSGYSLDNIEPMKPSGVNGTIEGSNFIIAWESPSQNDEVAHYRVYRSTQAGFTPDQSNLLADNVKSCSYTDADAGGNIVYYYKVVAVDDAGNESVPSDEISNLITSVTGTAAIPTEYTLHQNYPNPFNPSTTISFGIPSQSFVTLTIFDELGKEVAVLYSGEMAPGWYTKEWNASGLASGIYFCRLQAGSFVAIKKLILLK